MGRGQGAGRSRRAAIQTSSAGSPAESTPDGTGASPAVGRRIPGGAWVWAPLVAAALYAAAVTLLRRSPTLAEMVPDDAVATWRFKDVAAYDAARTPPDVAGQVVRHSPSEVLGAEINLPKLAGIDGRRPLLTVTLDPTSRPDSRYFVLPVEDASKVRETFASPDLLERHARSVVVHGRWAAAGWDLLTVDRAGSGRGVYPAERGEDWAVAVDWPRFVDAALRPDVVGTDPVRGVLAALGFAPPDLGRVPLVRDAWSRVELHGFPERVRADVWPTGPDLVRLLSVPRPPPTSPPLPALRAPARAEAWLSVDTHYPRVVALALGYAGLRWPASVAKDDFAVVGTGPALVYAEPAGGPTPSWTIVLEGAGPDLFPALGLPAPTREGVPLPAGAAPIAAPFGPAPAPGELAQRQRTGRTVVAVGVDAGVAAERRVAEPVETLPLAPAELARFGLSFAAAQRLLGPALGKTGLLAPLAGGAIEGSLSVEDGHLVLDLHRPR